MFKINSLGNCSALEREFENSCRVSELEIRFVACQILMGELPIMLMNL